MKKPKIKISLIDQKGHMGCHRGHRIGDTFDFDTERGALCPMAMHVAFPYIDILRYGGKLPSQPDGSIVFCWYMVNNQSTRQNNASLWAGTVALS